MTSLVVVTGSRYAGFSNWHTGSVVEAYRAQLLQGSWDPSGPGMERMSPALADGFSTTGPGKSY